MTIKLIGEIGINHNGDMGITKELISASKEAGLDLVKFQKRTIDKVYTKEFLDSSRESPWGKTQREQKEGLEFNKEQYQEIDEYCKDLGIEWFASAWDIDSQLFLRNFDCHYNKIASAMIVYDELLKEVAKEKKYTYISTGMTSWENIDNAVEIFSSAGCPFELMHCISTYPMDEKNANLKMIQTLKDRYGCPVGYSGHESGLAVSYAAASLGISSLERHITLDRAMYGSDQAASLEITGLNMLVGVVRKIELAMGDGVKKVVEEELPIAEKLREHLDWQ
tara:strand:+ start:12586 stop:13425 length:840 start_codon:yes stop_codon:yes gene_type:complete